MQAPCSFFCVPPNSCVRLSCAIIVVIHGPLSLRRFVMSMFALGLPGSYFSTAAVVVVILSEPAAAMIHDGHRQPRKTPPIL